MARMTSHSLGHMIGDVMNRIGRARVFRDALRIQIDRAGLRIHIHVLEHRTEHFRRRVNLRLSVPRESNDLGVATALEVEDAVIRPSMFVIADQLAFRIR